MGKDCNGPPAPSLSQPPPTEFAAFSGSGGSVGREGPIIQVGAAFGSTLGQLVAMPARQRALLIAATFNTPIGGIVFAVELMLPFATPLSLLWVGLSCVTATFIGRVFFGVLPSF